MGRAAESWASLPQFACCVWRLHASLPAQPRRNPSGALWGGRGTRRLPPAAAFEHSPAATHASDRGPGGYSALQRRDARGWRRPPPCGLPPSCGAAGRLGPCRCPSRSRQLASLLLPPLPRPTDPDAGCHTIALDTFMLDDGPYHCRRELGGNWQYVETRKPYIHICRRCGLPPGSILMCEWVRGPPAAGSPCSRAHRGPRCSNSSTVSAVRPAAGFGNNPNCRGRCGAARVLLQCACHAVFLDADPALPHAPGPAAAPRAGGSSRSASCLELMMVCQSMSTWTPDRIRVSSAGKQILSLSENTCGSALPPALAGRLWRLPTRGSPCAAPPAECHDSTECQRFHVGPDGCSMFSEAPGALAPVPVWQIPGWHGRHTARTSAWQAGTRQA